MPKDYYAILGVSKTASDDEIKKAFRRLAHEHHPDKGGDPLKFKDASEAYSVLSDKQKRATYDRFGSQAFEQGGVGGAGGFGGFSGFGGGAQGFNFDINDMGDLGDVLGDMFGFGGGGGSRGSRQKRGQNIAVDVDLTFREAIFGTDKQIKLYRQTTCSACKGSGGEAGTNMSDCKTCNGSGQIKQSQRTMFGTFQSVAPCSDCHGRGKKPEKPCHVCKGYGVEKREETLSIRIPAGVDSDMVLQVAGQGEAPPLARGGGQAGDLHVRLHIKSDAKFEREGNDLLTVESVPFSVLSLGGSINIETIDGAQDLRIDAGTPTGTIVTLRGKGVPYRNGGRGNQLIRLEADVPKKLSKEQKKLLEELKERGL